MNTSNTGTDYTDERTTILALIMQLQEGKDIKSLALYSAILEKAIALVRSLDGLSWVKEESQWVVTLSLGDDVFVIQTDMPPMAAAMDWGILFGYKLVQDKITSECRACTKEERSTCIMYEIAMDTQHNANNLH